MNQSFFTTENPLKIGTRGSELALAQAREVRQRLIKIHQLEDAAISIFVIKTMGDQIQDRPLSEIGGKGLFTKEIEHALLEQTIDIAVHSSKDMPSVLPEGLVLEVFLPREDRRDAFISNMAASLRDLPKRAVIGSSSLRRQAQLLRYRSDFQVITFRGNVQTRLKKLADGVAEATLLAAAGLHRLNMRHIVKAYLDDEAFLPACAQGAIGIETRDGDHLTKQFIAPLHDEATEAAILCERAFLKILDGSCRTPIAGFAQKEGERLRFRGEVLHPDGFESFQVEMEGDCSEAQMVGEEAGRRLKAGLSDCFLQTLHQR